MNIYTLHSKLFGTPRIIISNFRLDKEMVEYLANNDNSYPSENQWKLTDTKTDWTKE